MNEARAMLHEFEDDIAEQLARAIHDAIEAGEPFKDLPSAGVEGITS